jgi:anti-anti-sigma factor
MKHDLNSSSKTLTLEFPGDLISSNANGLRQDIFALLESDAIGKAAWQYLVLDLTAAKMIDSMGLNLLVTVIKLARSRNAAVVGRIASANVERVLVFTRLNSQMTLEMAA